MAAPKSDTDQLLNAQQPKDEVQEPKEEEKKEIESVPFIRKDESAQWAPYLKPKNKISSDRWNRSKPDYSHLFDALRKHKCASHLNKDGSVTFYPAPYLSNKELGSALLQQVPFEKSIQFQNIMKEVECTKLEASYDYDAKVVSAPNDVHGLIATLEIAFFKHYPLSLSVSQIWLLVLQALGMHIDQNSEALRKRFVNHDGKKTLTVERPNFVKGSKDNEWDGVIEEFVQQIDGNTVKDTVDLMDTNYSTTSAVEQIAGKVAIMDMMKHYFEYVMRCGCGFPQITLKGTKDDWILLKKKLEAILKQKVLKEFGVKWATAIVPVIDRFIAAYDGDIDCLFWNSMLRRGAAGGSMPGISGQTNIDRRNKELYYSGWFNIFFPLINPSGRGYGYGMADKSQKKADLKFQDNNHCVAYSDSNEYVTCGLDGGAYGPKMEKLPSGISSAPVKYVDVKTGKNYDMKFVAGFIGCAQDKKTLEVSPKIGWLIGEK